MRIDQVPTPAYVIDEAKLVNNLEILKSVQERTGCKVLLAQKPSPCMPPIRSSANT